MTVPDHDMDLLWEGNDRTLGRVSTLREEEVVAEGLTIIVGNPTLRTQEGEILVKGEAGGVQDEDQTGHGLETRNLNFWQVFALSYL